MTDSEALCTLESAMRLARKKHPGFARNRLVALSVVSYEMQGLQETVLWGEGRMREKAAALAVAVTAMRFYLEEYDQ